MNSTDAIALLMATQQMVRLNYSKVAFMGNCKSLFDELNQFKTEKTNRNVRITEAVFVPQDIFEISRHRDYTFHYLSRDNLNVVDSLAKQARLRKTMLYLGSFNVFNEKVDRKKSMNGTSTTMINKDKLMTYIYVTSNHTLTAL